MTTVKLTRAQRSALECADLSDCPHLRTAWNGGNNLDVPGGMGRPAIVRAAMVTEICELSNGEDALAENLRSEGKSNCRRMAAGAALALANLMSKIPV